MSLPTSNVSRWLLVVAGVLLCFAPACVIERIDRLLEERGVTWDPEPSTTTTGTTTTSSTSTTGATTDDPPADTSFVDTSTATTTDTAEVTSTTDTSSSTGPAAPVCGDGIINGDETCDDANDDPDDGCKLCATDSVVFVTSEIYQGGKLGGLDGADQRCRMRAAIAGVPRSGTFRAWLSDSTTAAADRLNHSPGRYVLITGLVVADDWDQLTSGTLQRPIDIDETSQYRSLPVWTGTLPSGQIAVGGTMCDDWTDHSMQQIAAWGVSSEASAYWSFVESSACVDMGALYCVQQ
jgi:cysteine-rich repeat protein